MQALEVVADLLLVGGAGGAGDGGLGEDGVELLRVDVVEDVEGIDVGLVGGDGVVGVEVAAGVAVHVGAGVGGEVHGGEIEAGEGLFGRAGVGAGAASGADWRALRGCGACWASEEGMRTKYARAAIAISERVWVGRMEARIAGDSLMLMSLREDACRR